MGMIIRLIEMLIVLVPVVGIIVAGVKALSAARGRPEYGPATSPQGAGTGRAAELRAITRTIQQHDRTDTRWLDYELDVARLLDFPLMTDMSDPLTQRFHRAKLRADVLRPTGPDDLLDDRGAAAQYLDAVEEYVTAFDVAEAEAIRRRQSAFSRPERQRISRAQSALRMAVDTAATPQERERAFDVARSELEGLIVLPERARAAIERGIAGELDR
jgi:hypothetical protein